MLEVGSGNSCFLVCLCFLHCLCKIKELMLMCMKIKNLLSGGFAWITFLKLLTCLSQWSQLPKNMKECKFLNKCRTIYHIFGLSDSEFTIPRRIGSKIPRKALAVMAHFFNATLVLSSSVSFLSWLQVLFDIDISKWAHVPLCQSLYKANLRAVIDLKNFQFNY